MKTLSCEKDVKGEVKRIFKKHNVWYHMPVQTGYSRKGVPDFLACMDGQTIAVETKFGKNGLSSHQSNECKALAAAGAVVLVIYEGDIPMLDWILRRITQHDRYVWWSDLPQHRPHYLEPKK